MCADLANRVLAGDVRAAALLMRDVDDRIPAAREVLKGLYPKTGRAFIIGITGPPGSGKSTLVDGLVEIFRKAGKSVGIVAVDPSSPFTGGAILGDRIRMQRHAADQGVFIRSVATRGCLGGLSRSTQDIVNVLDAMGKEVILVETVGVGQDEVDIVNTAHVSIVVLVPGMGDDIQAIKAGIIEIGDLFVINKCDREGAQKLERELRLVLEMDKKRDSGWEPPILMTDALSGQGLAELVQEIGRYQQLGEQSLSSQKKRAARTKAVFLGILQSEVMNRLIEKIEREKMWEAIIADLEARRTDPYSLAEEMIADGLAGR